MTNVTEETKNSDVIVIRINKRKLLIGLAATATVVGGFVLMNHLSKDTVIEEIEIVDNESSDN